MNDGQCAAVTEPVLPSRHQQVLRWTLRIGLGCIALIFAIWLVLFITKGRFLRPYFESFASRQLRRQVKVAGDFNLYFAPFNIVFRADGLTIANPAWAAPGDLLDANHIGLKVQTLPLLWGQHKISVAEVDGAQIALRWDLLHRKNNWTFGDPGAPPSPFQMPNIETGFITNTHVTYVDPKAQIALKVEVRPVTAIQSQVAQAVGFFGTGSLRNQPVRFSGTIDHAVQALRDGASHLVLHGTGADTALDLDGEMPGITNIFAGRYKLAMRGANMADAFEFIGVAAVPTRKYHLVADLSRSDGDRAGSDWVFDHIKGVFGDSDLAGRLSVGVRDDRVHLEGDLQTRSLDLIDGALFVGYDPKRLDRMGTKGLVTIQNGHPRILPDAPLRAGELRTFDSDVRYRVGVIAAKSFPISAIDVTLKLDHGLITIKPFSAIVATGKLDGSFVVDARPETVITDYSLRLHPTPMSKLFYRFGVEQSGTTGTMSARIALRGVGNSVRESLGHANGRIVAIIPAGTLWARNIQLVELDVGTFLQRKLQKKLKDPVEINCGLIGFTVNNGVSRSDPILIDTKKNVITGNGMFSFRDEALDMNINAKAKTFSLFSLQSPIGVGGYLAQPHIQLLSSQLLARGGAAIALGLVATPVAALLAFIDPGDGKAAACGPVLAGATASAQRTVSGKPRKDLGKSGH